MTSPSPPGSSPAPGAAPADAPPEPPPPELVPAWERFEAGDFAGARRELRRLLATQPTPSVAAAARVLSARLDVDPWALGAGLFALAVLVVVTGAYLF